MNVSVPPTTRTLRTFLTRTLAVAFTVATSACGGGGEVVTNPPETPPACDGGVICNRVELAPVGAAATFDVATWNLEWLGDPGNGPSDERLQQLQIAETLVDAGLDVWSVQEVVSLNAFNTVVDSTFEYSGLLANDPSVTDGPAFYSDFANQEQKVGLVWRSDLLAVTDARIILTEYDFEFAGRPPLEIQADVTVDGTTFPAVFVVLHAKAGADGEDWQRRTVAADALKSYLDTAWPDARVWVLGDFNDDVDVSIHAGQASPYDAFVDDPARWRFASQPLTLAGETSTTDYSDVIDHILVSDEVWALYVEGSADVLELDSAIPDYARTTSDHYPVLARFNPGE